MRAPKMTGRPGRAVWISAAVVLIATAGLLSRATAGTGAGVSWYGEGSIEDRQSGDTQDVRTTSEQHSSDCQDLYREQTNHANGKSSQDSDDIDWSNDKGDSAYQEVTWGTDADGNVTRHTVTSWTFPNGDRTTIWTDEVYDPASGTYKWKNGGSKRDKVQPLSEPHWSGAITVTETLTEILSKVNSGGDCAAVANVSNLQCAGTDSETIQGLITARLRPTGSEALITRKYQHTTATENSITGGVRCNQTWHSFKHEWKSRATEEGQMSTRGGVSVSVNADGRYEIKFSAPELQGISTRSGTDSVENPCMHVNNSSSDPPFKIPTSWPSYFVEVNGQVDPKHADSLSGQQIRQMGKMTETIAWSFTQRSRCPTPQSP